MKILLVAINAKYIHSNLAIYSLKTYANREEIELCEYTINNLVDEILDDIYAKKPDILAFSCYIWNKEYVEKLMVEIKKVLPNVLIWAGGPEAYYNSVEMLLKYKELDLVIKGEGEVTFKELCDYYIDRMDKDSNLQVINCEHNENTLFDETDVFLRNVKGIDFRNSYSQIVINPNREAMDMSQIPFPYRDMKDFANKIVYYESSRGCPFSCSYCLSSVEKTLRFRNIDLVKEELKFFLDNNVSQVKFVDRTFNCKKTHAMEIWKFISENDNGITNFHFEVAADLIDDEQLKLISKMRDGLIKLEIGVQSTNEKTIEEIHRSMKLDKLKKVVASINSYNNTHQHLDLIAGLPFEDLESFKKSFDDVYYMRPKELQLGFLKVLSGSYMYDNKDAYEIKYKQYPPYEVLSTKWISYEDILLLKGVEEMVEVYFNSGQFVFGLNFIENFFETPFNMFYELSKYYEEHYSRSVKHSRITRYTQLISFMEERIGIDELNKLKILLTFDIYLRENAKSRPEFAKDNSVYKEDIKYVAKSLGLRKDEHIEVLSKEEFEIVPLEELSSIVYVEYGDDVKEFLEEKDNVFIVFDYEYKNVITNQCKIKICKK